MADNPMPGRSEFTAEEEQAMRAQLRQAPSQAGRAAEEIGNGTDLPRSQRPSGIDVPRPRR